MVNTIIDKKIPCLDLSGQHQQVKEEIFEAFEKVYEKKKAINDFAITNNGDSLKVLATVASTVYAFTEKYPNAWIVATGSTNVRTRLYRMGIANNLDEIKEDFDVYAYTQNGTWKEFVIGEDYEAFLITRKDNNFTP